MDLGLAFTIANRRGRGSTDLVSTDQALCGLHRSTPTFCVLSSAVYFPAERSVAAPRRCQRLRKPYKLETCARISSSQSEGRRGATLRHSRANREVLATAHPALRRVAPAIVICVYFLIGVVVFWPDHQEISQHLLGLGWDFTQSVWFLDWIPHALADGLNPFAAAPYSCRQA